MFPADFAYARARSLDEALDLLDEAAAADEEAKLIAGGQSLLPMMKLRLAAPQVLIDIADLKELRGGGWTAQGSGFNVLIGALTTYRQLAQQSRLPRGPARRATAGTGAASAASRPSPTPSRSSPTPRSAPGARSAARWRTATRPPTSRRSCWPWTRRSPSPPRRQARANPAATGHSRLGALLDDIPNVGKREIPLDDFLQGIYTTDLAEDEIVTHVRIRTPGARGSAYEKFPHPASHLPLAGVCAVVRLRDGLIDGAEVAVTGISPRPYRAREAERLLTGAPPTQETLAAAAAQVTRLPGGGQVSLLGDQHASARTAPT